MHRRRAAVTLASLVAVVALSGCRHKKHVGRVPPTPTLGPTARVGDTETGLASWYGYPYHGRRAANGEIYDMEKLTAAHRTLPFETWVRVKNLDGGQAVDVRITDRGPFVEGRIIDLSRAAARQVGLLGPGVGPVRIEVIRAPEVAQAPVSPPPVQPEPVAAAHFAVQVGAFRDRANAERVRLEMQGRYGTARLVERSGNPAVWRVLVGDEPSQDAAQGLADRIRQEGNEKNQAFVVRLDTV